MDENSISPIVYDATVTAAEVLKKRHRLEIENVGEGWLTKRHWPNRCFPEGTKLKVNIVRDPNLERWLVSKIISIDGEPYSRHDYREFSGLDERYVRLGKKPRRGPDYGFQPTKKSFLSKWEKESFVDIYSYSESHEIIPNHPESKFSGTVIGFNNFVGWQGFIWCKEINSLVYVRHDIGRKEGSIVAGAKIEFYLGTSFDNRNELQFYATDWNSNENRGNAPEPALTFDFEDINDSKEIINQILTDKNQFVLITSLIQKETKRYSSDEVIKSLANKFPNHPTMVLPWPQFRLDKRNPNNSARSSAGRFSHPLIKNYLSCAVVLFPKEDGGEEE